MSACGRPRPGPLRARLDERFRPRVSGPAGPYRPWAAARPTSDRQTESSLSKLPGWPTQAIVTNATDALVPRPRRSHATPCYCWKWKSHKAELSVLSEQQWHRAQRRGVRPPPPPGPKTLPLRERGPRPPGGPPSRSPPASPQCRHTRSVSPGSPLGDISHEWRPTARVVWWLASSASCLGSVSKARPGVTGDGASLLFMAEGQSRGPEPATVSPCLLAATLCPSTAFSQVLRTFQNPPKLGRWVTKALSALPRSPPRSSCTPTLLPSFSGRGPGR